MTMTNCLVSQRQSELEKYMSGESDTIPQPNEEDEEEDEEDGGDHDEDLLKLETSDELKKRRDGFLRSVRQSLWSLSARIAKSIQQVPKSQVEEYRVVRPFPITLTLTSFRLSVRLRLVRLRPYSETKSS